MLRAASIQDLSVVRLAAACCHEALSEPEPTSAHRARDGASFRDARVA